MWARNKLILSMVLVLQQFFNFIRSILIRFWYFKKFLQFQSLSWNICFLFKRRKLSIDRLKSCLICDFIWDLSLPSWRWWSGVDSNLLIFWTLFPAYVCQDCIYIIRIRFYTRVYLTCLIKSLFKGAYYF